MTVTEQVAVPTRLDRALSVGAADRERPRIRWECIDVRWGLATELIVFRMRAADVEDRGGPC